VSVFAGVGPVLREVRLERRWTQEQLARRAGVSKSMISLYEMGRQRPQLDTLEKLLRALGLGVQELGRRLESLPNEQPELTSPWLLRGTAGRTPPRPLPPVIAGSLTEILHAMADLLRRALYAEPPPLGEETDDAAREAPTPRKSGGADTAIERRGGSSPRLRSR
jgi:transcriptional regulator with XRE-family HTH domain